MKKNFRVIIILTLSLIWLLILSNVGVSETTNQISQFGITWTLDREYEYGQFANGDYWVVGPVTIIAIDPSSTEGSTTGRTMNGSMINPSPIDGDNHGYDSIIGGYNHAYNAAFNVSPTNPLVLQPHTSLISTISIVETDDGRPLRPQLRTAAVLTVLGTPAPAGSFRPPYVGTDKTIRFNKSQLNYSKLSSLARPSSTPRLEQQPEDTQAASVERMFERVWLEHLNKHIIIYVHPDENMEDYGRDATAQIGDAALILNLDFTNAEKETLLIRFVQLGIDIYGVIQNGGKDLFTDGGGGIPEYKFPILFAGVVLNDSGMKSIGEKSGDYLYSGGYWPNGLPPDYIHFQGDDQTFYVRPADIFPQPYQLEYHRLFNAGNVKVTNGSPIVEGVGTSWLDIDPSNEWFGVVDDAEAYKPDGKPYKIASINSNTQLTLGLPYRGQTDTSGTLKYIISDTLWYSHGFCQDIGPVDYIEYTQEHLGMPDWGILHSRRYTADGLDWDAAYRRLVTYVSGGYVLAAHIMNMEELWNHDALFDYMDRYMEVFQDDPKRQLSDFADDMWDMYRADYGCVWTRYNPNDIYSNGYNPCKLIPSPSKGDINRDGRVNIQDVQCCVNHILGTQDWGSDADVNKDNKIDETDVQEIINIILTK